MKWEYQLMRDMVVRGNRYMSIPTDECRATGIMLGDAERVMLAWDRKITDLEIALKESEKRIEMLTLALDRIAACDWPGPQGVLSRADFLQEIAKEALK